MADVTKVKASDGTIYDVKDVSSYTKEETDALLADKVNVGVSYTKAEDDALLAEKADSSSVDSALALKANVVDVYSKTEADNLLAGKADTGVSYTKAEDDALLADKANAADVYTVAQTDALLDGKAGVDDSSTTATMATWSASKLNVEFQDKADSSDVYTKAEVDALIGGIKMAPLLDFANPLHTFDTVLSYTADEECWLTGTISGSNASSVTVSINGTLVGYSDASNVGVFAIFVPPIRIVPGDTIVTTRGLGALSVYKERSV